MRLPRQLRLLAMTVVFFLSTTLYLPTTIFADHLPKPTNYINDFADVLSSDQETDLNNQLYNFEQDSQNQIAVAIVKSLKDEPIEDFAVKAFEEWKIGNQEKDNGVLMVVSIDDRKIRIEVGYGSEGFLTDGEAGEIIRNLISPEFKNQNYYQGIKNGLSSIQTQLSEEGAMVKQVDHKATTSDILKLIWNLVVGLNFFLLIPIVYFASYMSRTKSIWAGGVAGGVVGLIIGLALTSLLVGLIASGILGLLGLLLDYLLSRTYQRRKDAGKSTDWWHSGGGFWYGGGGSSGGFGGFGGGSSGGGGASGDW